MADVIGLHGIHDVTGYKCDLCGDPCDPSCNELNALSCTFANCPVECSVYHQDCLEKYLKSVRLEKNRKTGFKCPRGCGKGSSYSEPCPGKIDKSHPIHIRNDGAKKRKKAPALPPVQPKFVPKEKGKAKEEDAKKGKADKKDAVGAKPKEKEAAKPSLGKLSATPLMKAAAKPTKAELKAAAAVAERDRVAAALHAARKELGLKTDSAAKAAALGSKAGAAGREIQTFEEYEAARGSAAPASSSTAPTLNAWDGEEGEHRLTKAQRKNLKRAEKAKAKAAQQQGKAQAQRGQHAGGAAPVTGPSEGDSVASSELTSEIALSGILQTEPSDLEQSDLELSDHERCVQILTMHKALYLVAQLQQLGFPEWQCIPAVQHHGSNLEAAVIFLLDGNIASEEDARRTMQSAGMTAPDVDITEELNQLADAKSWLKFPAHIIERAVVEYNGDIDAAISALFERQDQLMPDHGGGLLGHGVAAVHSMGSIAQQAGRAGNGNGNGSASLVGGIATLEVHDRQDAAMNSHHLGTEYNASAPNGYPSVYGNGLSSLTGTGSGHDHFTTAPSGLAASPMGLMSSRTQSNISDLFGSHFGEGEYGAALGRAPSQASLGGNETGSTWSVDSAAGLGLANGLANGVLSSSLGTAASASRQQQAQYFGGQPYASQGAAQSNVGGFGGSFGGGATITEIARYNELVGLVTSEPDAPHHNSGGEDQNELDALVAALMCR
ncbi:hypothetical protein WJX72_010679 [[Myrmecia] bisecta]|uniref:UBA domain-containing protein n=1 Tax=[Myrmecia] bisecta TaxID=41462 RepID=A0AAW1PYS1_9CHLO